MVACRWCGARPDLDSRCALIRVNPTGEEGIWECTPYCKEPMQNEDAKEIQRPN